MNSHLNTEHQLLQRFTEGNVKAFSTIYNTYYHQLVYFGFTLTNNQLQSEDSATEAFINLWKVKHTFTSYAHIKRYLFLSVKHKCIDYIRSAKTHAGVHEQLRYLAVEDENTLEHAMAESEVIREIYKQINDLPEQCGKVFCHIFFDGLSTDEVSSLMNISTKNVLNQKSIAVKQIRMGLLKKGLLALMSLLWVDVTYFIMLTLQFMQRIVYLF